MLLNLAYGLNSNPGVPQRTWVALAICASISLVIKLELKNYI